MESPWFLDDEEENTEYVKDGIYFGIFTEDPAIIGMSLERPQTPIPSSFNIPPQLSKTSFSDQTNSLYLHPSPCPSANLSTFQTNSDSSLTISVF